MCGEKREGIDDTGPEGIEHRYDCGGHGAVVWIYGRINAIRDKKDLEIMVLRDMLMDAYMDELGIDKDAAHASVAFDFENRLAAEDGG